jgi:hypothetical protein
MLSALVAFALLAIPAQTTRDYVDEGGAFALKIPFSYTTEHSDFGDGLDYTAIADPKAGEDSPQIGVLCQSSDVDLKPSDRAQITSTVISVVSGILADDGEIVSQKKSEVKFDGHDATKVDAVFKDEAGTTYKGWTMVVVGRRNVVVVMPYAPASDAPGWKLVEGCANTCAIEKKTPNAGASSSGPGLLNREALAQIGGAMKGNLKRDAMDKVLVDGNPPLTYGSIANFVNVIELLFDIQFTEAEFNATRARFIEYYNKQDAKGKGILAQQGASILKGLTEGSAAEIQQNRDEVRPMYANAFEKGAAQGDPYASVMWSAIERRHNTIGTAKGTAKDGWDTEITEADIEAALEMLYFMWVAAGRDATDVTAEDVNRIRTNIYEELPQMDAQLQLVIANAQKVYAGMRQQWMAATMEQRYALGVQYGQALDSFGLPEGGVTETAGSGGSGSDGSMLAACAQNTAWNAAKTWTTTSSN